MPAILLLVIENLSAADPIPVSTVIVWLEAPSKVSRESVALAINDEAEIFWLNLALFTLIVPISVPESPNITSISYSKFDNNSIVDVLFDLLSVILLLLLSVILPVIFKIFDPPLITKLPAAVKVKSSV